jgi:hypothetical protein
MKRGTAVTAMGLAALVVACSGGSGGPARQLSTNREPGTEGPEPAGAGGQEGASTGPESTGGGGSGGGGDAGLACITCDASYTCVVVGQQQSVTVQLSSSNGKCYIGSSSDGAEIKCDGTIVVTTEVNGSTQVQTTSWTPYANGGFQFVSKGATVQCAPAPVPHPAAG